MKSFTFAEKYGCWALVTGAAMGLGAEFARQIAGHGINLVLVDIKREALEATAQEIVSQSGVQVRPMVVNLVDQDNLFRLVEACEGLEIGLLVNNAGISSIGPFLDIPLEKHLAILALNARAPMLLSHHFASQMRQRGRGGIIFVSSGSAVVGTSHVGSYSATKGFNLNLGEALWEELRDTGVDVLATIVGNTETPGWRAENPRPETKTFPALMQPSETVGETLAALGKTSSFYPGIQNRLAMFIVTRLLPRPAAVRMVGAEMRKRYKTS
jgi:short-subunit dehydrogenase